MVVCSVDGCDAKVKSLGMCSKHYQRFRKYGTSDDYLGCHNLRKKCSVDGCEKEYEAKGLCHKHYQRFKRYGSPEGGNANHASTEERFWRYVDKSGDCWIWLGGSKTKKGYGMIQVGGKGSPHKLAHRLSYEIHHGQIPEGMVVMHICDNPSCVNPNHLNIGTYSENTRDAISKGRWTQSSPPTMRGAKHPKAKLTPEAVTHIQTCGLATKDLAKQYDVALSTIIRARNGKNWKQPNG